MVDHTSPASSLLAMLLVVKSSRGANVVYSYPPGPRAVPRTSKPIYHTSRRRPPPATTTINTRNSGYSDESSTDSDDDSSETDSDEDDHHDSHFRQGAADDLDESERAKGQQYLGFPSTVLASLLSPSRELCDQPFELVVDHLAFVGHPVWLGDDEPSSAAATRKTPRTGQDDDEDDGDDDDDEDDRRGRTRRRSPATAPSAFDPPSSAEPSPPVTTSSGTPRAWSRAPLLFDQRPPSDPVTVNHSPIRPASFIRTSSSASTLHPFSSFASSDNSHTSIHGGGRLLAFNFVCVIDTPPDSHLSSHLEGYYKDVVVPVTANVKALERKDKWLGKESVKLLKAIERAVDQGIPPAEVPASVASVSSLAAALNRLFIALKADQLANITLGHLPVQVLMRGEVPIEEEYDTFYAERNELIIKDLGPGGIGGGPETNRASRSANVDDAIDASRARSVSPAAPAEAFQQRRPPPLFSRMRRRPPVRFQPWETLLPLEDPDDLRKDVQDGTLLAKFLEFCSPTLSFAEYATLLDVDADDQALRDVVQHLVYWRKGKIIDVVSLKGTYFTSSDIPLHSLVDLTFEFNQHFPDLPRLPTLLSKLSPNEPFSSIIPPNSKGLRPIYYNALLFLLRHELVQKQRTFVRLVAPEAIKKEALMKWGSTSSIEGRKHPLGGRSRRASSIGSGARLSELSTSGGARSRGGPFGSGGGGGGGISEEGETMSISFRSSERSSPPPGLLSRSAGSRGGPKKRTTTGKPKAMSSATYSSSGAPDVEDDVTSKGPSVIVEPGRPTMLESRWIAEMTREVDEALKDRFDRMRPFLNGSHHLDEMRHRSSLTRRDVRLVLTHFEHFLVLFTHP